MKESILHRVGEEIKKCKITERKLFSISISKPETHFPARNVAALSCQTIPLGVTRFDCGSGTTPIFTSNKKIQKIQTLYRNYPMPIQIKILKIIPPSPS